MAQKHLESTTTYSITDGAFVLVRVWTVNYFGVSAHHREELHLAVDDGEVRHSCSIPGHPMGLSMHLLLGWSGHLLPGGISAAN